MRVDNVAPLEQTSRVLLNKAINFIVTGIRSLGFLLNIPSQLQSVYNDYRAIPQYRQDRQTIIETKSQQELKDRSLFERETKLIAQEEKFQSTVKREVKRRIKRIRQKQESEWRQNIERELQSKRAEIKQITQQHAELEQLNEQLHYKNIEFKKNFDTLKLLSQQEVRSLELVFQAAFSDTLTKIAQRLSIIESKVEQTTQAQTQTVTAAIHGLTRTAQQAQHNSTTTSQMSLEAMRSSSSETTRMLGSELSYRIGELERAQQPVINHTYHDNSRHLYWDSASPRVGSLFQSRTSSEDSASVGALLMRPNSFPSREGIEETSSVSETALTSRTPVMGFEN